MARARKKIVEPVQIGQIVARHRAAGRTVVHCHGCFDIVHPGHLRYLEFARAQGDVLVVSLTSDDAIEKNDGTRPHVPQELRAETLAALELVDHVLVSVSPTAEGLIEAVRPDVYVKGKEYESSDHPGFLAERAVVERHGGRVVFSSGEVVFSSTAILHELHDALGQDGLTQAVRLKTTCARWGVNARSVSELITGGMRGKKVVVVGDLISDRYVFCHARDVASEAPVLSVSPLETVDYVGGAAIIASHVRAMGGRAHLLGVRGRDEASDRFEAALEQRDVELTLPRFRPDLPRKLRYVVDQQKLLKVDEGAPRPLDSDQEKKMLDHLVAASAGADAVIFADFGYGTLTASFLRQAMAELRPRVPLIAGDVSGHRDTLLAFEGADLLTPTEKELRSIRGDFASSLPGVAQQLMAQLRVGNLMVTMGSRGCLLFRPREDDPERWFSGRLRSDYLPALGGRALDPVGAGDAMLAATVLSLCGGADLATAGYVGSAAAALAISQIGNHAIRAERLLGWLAARPELASNVRLVGPSSIDILPRSA